MQDDKKDTSLDESGGCNCARSARLKAPSHTRCAVKWMSDELRSMCVPEATEAEIKGGRPAKTQRMGGGGGSGERGRIPALMEFVISGGRRAKSAVEKKVSAPGPALRP